jgi:hypothetical protein
MEITDKEKRTVLGLINKFELENHSITMQIKTRRILRTVETFDILPFYIRV